MSTRFVVLKAAFPFPDRGYPSIACMADFRLNWNFEYYVVGSMSVLGATFSPPVMLASLGENRGDYKNQALIWWGDGKCLGVSVFFQIQFKTCSAV